MSDIRKFAVEETSVIELRSASDEPMVGDDGKPMTWTVYGPGSKPYAKAQAAQQNRMIDKLKRKGKTDETADEKMRDQAEFLAGCTKECSSNIEYDGLQGEAMHRAVLSDRSIGFIAEQVGRHLGEWGNFSKPSTTTSASTSGKALG
jgi:hypothetical protein